MSTNLGPDGQDSSQDEDNVYPSSIEAYLHYQQEEDRPKNIVIEAASTPNSELVSPPNENAYEDIKPKKKTAFAPESPLALDQSIGFGGGTPEEGSTPSKSLEDDEKKSSCSKSTSGPSQPLSAEKTPQPSKPVVTSESIPLSDPQKRQRYFARGNTKRVGIFIRNHQLKEKVDELKELAAKEEEQFAQTRAQYQILMKPNKASSSLDIAQHLRGSSSHRIKQMKIEKEATRMKDDLRKVIVNSVGTAKEDLKSKINGAALKPELNVGLSLFKNKQVDKAKIEAQLDQIYDISDILDQLSLREDDVKKVVAFLQKVHPPFREKLQCLSNQMTRKVVESLKFQVYRRGQVIFEKRDRCDFAYIVLFGELAFFDDKKKEATQSSARGSTVDEQPSPLRPMVSPRMMSKRNLAKVSTSPEVIADERQVATGSDLKKRKPRLSKAKTKVLPQDKIKDLRSSFKQLIEPTTKPAAQPSARKLVKGMTKDIPTAPQQVKLSIPSQLSFKPSQKSSGRQGSNASFKKSSENQEKTPTLSQDFLGSGYGRQGNQSKLETSQPAFEVKNKISDAEGNIIYDTQLIQSDIINFAQEGQLTGEVSMIQKEHDDVRSLRLFNCVCHSEFCILIALNQTVFDLLLREKIKKQREYLAKFVYTSLPGVSQNYTFTKVLSSIGYVWEMKTISKGEVLTLEGCQSNRLYIIKEGQVSLFKRLPSLTNSDQRQYRSYRLMTLEEGTTFGEDKLFFHCPNRYTARVTSMRAVVVSIKISDFHTYYKRIINNLKEVLDLRHKFAQRQLQKIKESFKSRGLTNFEYHVWNSKVKPKEICWEQIPIFGGPKHSHQAGDLPDGDSESGNKMAMKKQSHQAEEAPGNKTYFTKANINPFGSDNHPQPLKVQSNILCTFFTRDDISSTLDLMRKHVQVAERIKQAHHLEKGVNSVKFGEFNVANLDTETIPVMQTNKNAKALIDFSPQKVDQITGSAELKWNLQRSEVKTRDSHIEKIQHQFSKVTSCRASTTVPEQGRSQTYRSQIFTSAYQGHPNPSANYNPEIVSGVDTVSDPNKSQAYGSQVASPSRQIVWDQYQNNFGAAHTSQPVQPVRVDTFSKQKHVRMRNQIHSQNNSRIDHHPPEDSVSPSIDRGSSKQSIVQRLLMKKELRDKRKNLQSAVMGARNSSAQWQRQKGGHHRGFTGSGIDQIDQHQTLTKGTTQVQVSRDGKLDMMLSEANDPGQKPPAHLLSSNMSSSQFRTNVPSLVPDENAGAAYGKQIHSLIPQYQTSSRPINTASRRQFRRRMIDPSEFHIPTHASPSLPQYHTRIVDTSRQYSKGQRWEFNRKQTISSTKERFGGPKRLDPRENYQSPQVQCSTRLVSSLQLTSKQGPSRRLKL